jgi:hypothetical protein
MKKGWILFYLLIVSYSINAQMIVGTDTLYGNEWINHSQTYLKIEIAEDGIYRLDGQALSSAGVPMSTIQGSNYQIFHLGKEIPTRTSTNTSFGTNDYIEFFGEKNRSYLDSFLFKNPSEDLLNPYYSLFTDTSAYYLTWNNGTAGLRYQNVANNLSSPPAKEDYFMYDEVEVLNTSYIKKRADGYKYDPKFEIDGFANNLSANWTKNLSIPHLYANGANSSLTIRMAVGEDDQHQQLVKIDGTTYIDEAFSGFQLKEYTISLTTASLGTTVEVKTENTFNSKDKSATSFIRLNYPRAFNFDNANYFDFYINANTGTTYLEINNFDASNSPILYDLTNQVYINATYDAAENKVKVVLPPSTEKRQLILVNSIAGYKSISTLQSTNFINFAQLDHDYIIISNSKLYNDPASGINHVQEYADYRATAQGGNYSSIVIDVNDLYEQFTYGVERTPISIRNFGHFIKKNWTNPKYVFIIGKGLEYNYVRTSAALATHSEISLVPTYGFLGSDNLLLAPPNMNIPVLPLGRLAAISPNEVRIYLDKVKKHENTQALSQTLEDKEWMKRIVHLGGGDPSIQNSIKNSLKVFETEIENNEYGGEVITFLKTSSDPIQISQTELLTNTINEGVSIMTFFGHSYAGGFDVSLDEPSFYENEGKFPMIISYGCYTGRIHAAVRGISEGFVFEENKGAIAFMSANGFATVYQLNVFGLEFYKQLGRVNYNKGIGDAMLQTNENTQGALGTIPRTMTLHGDPAIRLNTHPGADYLIDPASVVLSPNTIDIQEDSFALSFDVMNIGSNPTSTPIGIKVTQQFPSGELFIIKIDSIIPPAFRKSMTYNLPTLGEGTVGLNRFFIEVDYENNVDELPAPEAETNNSLVDNNGMVGVPVFFTSSNVNPIYPNNYGIVGDPNLTLRAAPSNVLAASQTYIFELDTTMNFNSSFRQQTKITQSGGVIEWKPTVNYQDSTVYYWRVSPDSISSLGYTWSAHSFIYINNIDNGFNQSHYYQYQKNSYSNIRLKENTREIAFIDDFKDIIIKNRENSNPLDKMDYSINNELIELFRPGVMGSNTGLFIAVMDSFTIEPWSNPPGGLYGSVNSHGSRSWNVFPFETNTETERQEVVNFLENVVPSGNYVLVMTIQRNVNDSYFPEQWAADSINLGTNIFQTLESQGATLIRNTEQTGSLPYLFLYKKDGTPLNEQLANNVTDELTAVVPIAGSWDEGYVESEKIGPASSWETLKWNAISDNNAQNDHYNLDVLGVKSDNSDTLLYQNLTVSDMLLNSIDANDFPYIKLRFNSLDTTTRTSAHLDYWRVYYQGLPELAIVPNKHFSFYNDTLQQGERMDFEVGVQNISQYNVDSVLVKYTITDINNNQSVAYQQLKPLASEDTLHARFSFDTDELRQLNQVTFEVNPNQNPTEQYIFNNTAIKSFYVNQDSRHPLLDVTFDGLHILEGDIVSTTPQSLISLKDENPYLALNDTALFKVWIIDPSGNQRRYYNDGNTMIFYPADESNLSASNNRARLELQPNLTEDGIYQLIVQAQDRTGNSSGSIDYKVSFEIVTESMISYVLNYPNPFTTSTQFVFTLTGAQVPDDLRIQIYTVSGRLIREITKEELGNIRIGQNRTDFRWDGTDEFGDRLANGVYLYRVIATINGEELDNFYTKASPFFTNGFGKMVLMR